jgi:hypothetical protein
VCVWLCGVCLMKMKILYGENFSHPNTRGKRTTQTQRKEDPDPTPVPKGNIKIKNMCGVDERTGREAQGYLHCNNKI